MLPDELRNHFLTWQCRIRQIAMREQEGRPNQGMRPRVLDASGKQLSAGIIVLLVREDSFESTEFLKFQVQKYNDPQDVYKKALIFLQSTHYHRAAEFSDEMTGLFSKGSALVEGMMSGEKVTLQFSQFSQNYSIPCRTRLLETDEAAYQATLWHNRVFNPNIGEDIEIVGFQPDWNETAMLMDSGAKAAG
ncbi:MAG: hypothetical protein HKP56_10665 [Anderseniella sp.]|nr:hypothetical protein [Anderseniella sp.]